MLQPNDFQTTSRLIISNVIGLEWIKLTFKTKFSHVGMLDIDLLSINVVSNVYEKRMRGPGGF